MTSVSSPENIHALQDRLGEIDREFQEIEMEELVLYGDMEKSLKLAGIGCEA